MNTPLDPRLNAFRPDLADQRLFGRVEAKSYSVGKPMRVAVPLAPVLKSPDLDAVQTSQALLGEECLVFETAHCFSWVQLIRDGYVGYVEQQFLSAPEILPTHRVCVLSTLVFPKADLRSRPPTSLPLNAEVTVTAISGAYAELAQGGFVFSAHLAPLEAVQPDFVAVAELFVGTPYLWGGKSAQGIDCSGLVQVSLQASGIAAPRDSDMQEKGLGRLANDKNYRRGDLIFWPGHVGIMVDEINLLHANGHSMSTLIEPLSDVVHRSEVTGKPITSIKRL